MPAVILAGGGSRRFGSNKALARIGQVQLIEHIVELARVVTGRVLIVSKEPGLYAFPGVESIADTCSSSTPVAGIITAMEYLAPCPELLILSCDTIWHPEDLLERLTSYEEPYGDALLVSHHGERHPFPGRYAASALPFFREAMDSSDLRIVQITGRMETQTIDVEGWWMKNINRIEDLHEARNDKEELLRTDL